MLEKNLEVYVVFTPEKIQDKTTFCKLLEALMDLDYEIKITSDGYCTIVEAQRRFSDEGFKWVREEEVVVPASCVNYEELEKYENQK